MIIKMPDYKPVTIAEAKKLPGGSHISVKGMARGIVELRYETLGFYLQDKQDFLYSFLKPQPQQIHDSDHWYFKLMEILCTLRSSSESGVAVTLDGQIERKKEEYRYTVHSVTELVVEKIILQDIIYEV